MLYWEKRDHEKNRHNWHAATFGHDLLGDLVLTRSWGSLGRGGWQRRQPLASTDELRACLRVIGAERELDGYAVVAAS